jgi:antitoxin (DNA-binding transcriptional repressor) of toxin-antitoxin stability system
MTGVRFITVTELSLKATAMVADAEKMGEQIVITKKGKPVALLKKVDRDSKGKSETVTKLKNNAIAMIESVEVGGKYIITRNEKPVAVLSKITDSDFRIAK